MRVYLDLCALKRLFDETLQDRVRLEAEAVAMILERADGGEIELCSSEALEQENLLNPDPVRRARAGGLLAHASHRVRVTAAVSAIANRLQGLGFGGYDALHIACALRARALAVVTSDDRLVRLAARHTEEVPIRVINPVDFVHS